MGALKYKWRKTVNTKRLLIMLLTLAIWIGAFTIPGMTEDNVKAFKNSDTADQDVRVLLTNF